MYVPSAAMNCMMSILQLLPILCLLIQIIVEGIIGYNYTSDTAIDDVMLYDAPCGSTPAPPTTIPTFGKKVHLVTI